MYNSYTVRILTRFWNKVIYYYNYSFIKAVFSRLGNSISMASSGSVIKRIFTNKASLIEKSLIYRFYTAVINFIEKISDNVRSSFNRLKEGSILCRVVYDLTNGKEKLITTLSVSIIGFGLAIIATRVFRGNIISYTNIAALTLIIIAIFCIALSNKSENIIDNSYIVKLVKDIFTIDDGGDKWW